MQERQFQVRTVPQGTQDQVRVVPELPVLPWQVARQPLQGRQGNDEALRRLLQVAPEIIHASSRQGP